MTVCPVVWPLLVLGFLRFLGPRRQTSLWTAVWSGLCIATLAISLLAFLFDPIAAAMGMDLFAQRAVFAIGLWSAAFGWTFTRSHDAAAWGSVVLAGLFLAATSTNLIGLAFAIEMVGIATSHRHKGDGVLDRMTFPGLSIGAMGCLAVTGSLDLVTIREVLTTFFAPGEPLVAIGRPTLVFVGSVTFWMIAALAPIGVRALSIIGDSRGEPMEHQLAAVTARQLVGMFALSRWIATGLPGLEATLATLLVMLSLVACAFAAWMIQDRQRLDRLLAGLVFWQCGGQLLWLTAWIDADVDSTVAGWLPLSWSHDLLTLAAIAAVAVGWVARSSPVAYLEELRGLLGLRPMAAVVLLIALASLLGGPLLAGGWLRLVMASQLFGLHRLGADELWLPRLDVRYALLLWGVAWITCMRAAVEVARVILLETPLRMDTQPRGWWTSTVAITAAICVIAAGCWPQLLTWFAR